MKVINRAQESSGDVKEARHRWYHMGLILHHKASEDEMITFLSCIYPGRLVYAALRP